MSVRDEMSDEQEDEQCRQLLQSLKSTAEGLLVGHSTNVWSVYGGLQRLHSAVLKILQHGLRIHNSQGVPDPWAFVEALQWLQPSLATSPPFRPSLLKNPNTPGEDSGRNEKYSEWLFKSLESHSLSNKLSWLLSDRSHLESCYEPFAFLTRQKHSEAALICLRAVEQGQPSLLNDLDPRLYLSQLSSKQFVRSHRRCSSFPDNIRPCIRQTRRSTTLPHLKLLIAHKAPVERHWRSEPSLFIAPKTKHRDRSSTTSAVGRSKSTFNLEAAMKQLQLAKMEKDDAPLSSSPADKTDMPKRPNNLTLSAIIQEDTPKSVEKQSDLSVIVEPCSEALTQEIPISPPPQPKTHKRMPSDPFHLSPSKLTTPGSSLSMSPQFMSPFVVPACGSFDRKPTDVTSFLASAGKFSDPAEELGRENAHFCVSEAMIAAIERAKCERKERTARKKLKDESVTDDTVNSDEEDDVEIARLQEKIRARRREKEQREKRLSSRLRRANRSRKQLLINPLTSDGRTDTPNTDQSSVTPPSSPSSSSDQDGSQDLLIDSDQPGMSGDNLARVGVSGLSMSLASLYSESELAARQPGNSLLEDSIQSHRSTAEGVALALLSRFKGKGIPRASELQWLVSENEVKQQLLPLPSSWPVSPDDAEDQDMTRATQLRGTLQWAPPRPQIIFTPHAPPNRRTLLAKQSNMCAGCGMRVEAQYTSKMRYCEYLGRYFCTGCHGNQVAIIPGRVITKWDFSRCPVSNFSYRLLDQMQNDALFSLEQLNPQLFRKSRQLAKCKVARIQLVELAGFVSHCRFADEARERLSKAAGHLTRDTELYSMADLCAIKSGELMPKMQELVTLCQHHVAGCTLCPARGFICELCRNNEVIYPWEVSKVIRCRHCGCCLHLSCWKGSNSPPPSEASPRDCPRCVRLSTRKQHE